MGKSPEARPSDGSRSALGEMERGRLGKAREKVGFDGGGTKVAGDEGVPRRTHAGAREEGRSGAQFRLGSGRGASVGYGEAFASVNLTGEQRGWALHGEL